MYLTQGLHRALQQHPECLATVYDDRVRTYREHADREHADREHATASRGSLPACGAWAWPRAAGSRSLP